MSTVATITFSNGSCDIVSGDIDNWIARYQADDRSITSVVREEICDACGGSGKVHNKRKCRKTLHYGCMVKCRDC